jgi:hypothetical protein
VYTDFNSCVFFSGHNMLKAHTNTIEMADPL